MTASFVITTDLDVGYLGQGTLAALVDAVGVTVVNLSVLKNSRAEAVR